MPGMDDDIGQRIADQLSLIAKSLDVQNEHLRTLNMRLESIEDQVNYVGQGVASMAPPDENAD